MEASTVEAIAACVTAVATIILAVAAAVQLPLVGKQVKELATQIDNATKAEAASDLRQREWRTLEICQKYDFDPVIEDATKRIWAASEGGKNYKHVDIDKRDVKCVMNYIDGVAGGIRQGFYIENLVKDHMIYIFQHGVVNFIHTGIVEEKEYESIVTIYNKWFPKPAVANPTYTRSN